MIDRRGEPRSRNCVRRSRSGDKVARRRLLGECLVEAGVRLAEPLLKALASLVVGLVAIAFRSSYAQAGARFHFLHVS